MKLAFMFSGQGSQYVTMGKELYDKYPDYREVFRRASEILGYDLEKIVFEDEESLNNTKYTQVAMFTMYQGILKVLERHDITADYSFGLSLGEYGALLHNRVFDFETGLKIVQKRSSAMEKAADLNPGKMCAIIGMDTDDLEKIIEKTAGYVKIANYNTYGQLVISGEAQAVSEVSKLANEFGAKRVITLNTSGAFHTKLMESAAVELGEYLSGIDLKEPEKKLLINLTGKAYQSNIKNVMVQQIVSSVRFYQMVETAIEDGIDTFIEIGPKKTLCSFVKKIDRNVNIFNVENEASLQNLLNGLER